VFNPWLVFVALAEAVNGMVAASSVGLASRWDAFCFCSMQPVAATALRSAANVSLLCPPNYMPVSWFLRGFFLEPGNRFPTPKG